MTTPDLFDSSLSIRAEIEGRAWNGGSVNLEDGLWMWEKVFGHGCGFTWIVAKNKTT